MRVAIVGAGFAGLALCWHLLKSGRCAVSLFDGKGVGGGASGISGGLLHPYPGECGRRSRYAEEALGATKELLQIAEEAMALPVANYEGIMRLAQHQEQREHLMQRISAFKDIEQVGEGAFLIKSGVTVYPSLYLEGLWRACRHRGALLYQREIDSLEDLEGYDRVILACGAGISRFLPSSAPRLKMVKGQILTCGWHASLPPLTRSLIAKGYIALSEKPEICYLGATFERDFTSERADPQWAIEELIPKMEPFFPMVRELPILACRTALRVVQQGSYLPLIKQMSERCWLFTALGSRGLLYHAYFADLLSRILLGSQNVLPFFKSGHVHERNP
jgi:glycine/D-amino acid oxidase-like deaminating enzyme